MLTSGTIQSRLFALQDKAYAVFQRKLLPTVAANRIIGVRTPALRLLSKELVRGEDTCGFLRALPHKYFDENQLHAFIISETKDFPTCISELEEFLPYIDNWATCDQLLPHCFGRHRQELLPYIRKWLADRHTYTVRFGIGMLMQYFLDEDFRPEYLDRVVEIKSEEYYIRMMQAWYFATALAKQWDATIPYLEKRDMGQERGLLDVWTHNMIVRKACESYRITPGQKAYLRTLRRRE